ncbi:hypothetical protein ABT274_41130 [Streptomyces sp. NPDC001127]|uniref:hypothetical protein n=1 Tax=Streptomyces sp. NPDC001127 TaxID=3154377 RepID=UPI003320B700
MPIRDCRVIAVEGTQAAGKTTFVHALTSHLRERSINVNCTGEPARVSPFMEDIVLNGKGDFDLVAELDLLAQHFTVPLRAARHHQVLITDKTPANVLALAGLVLDSTEPGVAAVLSAAEVLCRSWMSLAYDVVLYCEDRYDQKAGGPHAGEGAGSPGRSSRGDLPGTSLQHSEDPKGAHGSHGRRACPVGGRAR